MIDMTTVGFRLAAARRIMYRNGCDSTVAGHLSARAADGEGFVMTPFEYFDETLPTGTSTLDWDLNVIGSPSETSPAASFHSSIYRRRDDVGAIAHIHSHWVSVLASTDQFIGMYNVGASLFHEEQADYVDDGTVPSVDGERMADRLGSRSVLLMRNHGAVVVADTIEHAAILALMLEQSARYHLECTVAGGREIAEDEVRRVKGQYHKYFLDQMWTANLRRLRRSDPDLFESDR
ncbi:MAG: class II aldolase/adducin family protein [Ilumatobacteraceae bacterium]|nr:class II aldolase/adducin family protein [Ilumatobacteraceae bacterium]